MITNQSLQLTTGTADDHKMLVELACSTTLVPAYNPLMFNKLVPRLRCRDTKPIVVFIVCGGFKINIADLREFRNCLEDNMAKGNNSWTVKYDDGQVSVITKQRIV
jgi:L-serine/L-threonine ammonia-lyase